MLRVIKAFFPAVIIAYVLASVLVTQSVLASVASFGLPVDPLVRLQTTLQDLVGMATSYLPLILVAFLLGLPVAAALARARGEGWEGRLASCSEPVQGLRRCLLPAAAAAGGRQ